MGRRGGRGGGGGPRALRRVGNEYLYKGGKRLETRRGNKGVAEIINISILGK